VCKREGNQSLGGGCHQRVAFAFNARFSVFPEAGYLRENEIGLPHSVKSVQDRYLMASGQSCELTEAVVCAIKTHSFSWKSKFLVFDQCPAPCILGNYSMSFTKVRLDFGSHHYSSGFDPTCNSDFQSLDFCRQQNNVLP
jgi:hypothetical protein